MFCTLVALFVVALWLVGGAARCAMLE